MSMIDYDHPLFDPEDDPADEPEVHEVPFHPLLPLWDDPETIEDRSHTTA